MTSSFNERLYKCMVCSVIIVTLGCAIFENELKARFIYEEMPLAGAIPKAKALEIPMEKIQENQEISMHQTPKHGTIKEGADSDMTPTPSDSESTIPTSAQTTGKGDLERINHMSIAEYETLNGVGPVLAKRIYEDRLKNGPFKSLAELNRVKGIGDKKLKKILDSLK